MVKILRLHRNEPQGVAKRVNAHDLDVSSVNDSEFILHTYTHTHFLCSLKTTDLIDFD